MFQKFKNLLSIMRRLSVNTHIWCLCVVCGSVLLTSSFFSSSNCKIAEVEDTPDSSEKIVLVEYSSVLGSISKLDSLDGESVDEISSIIPDETEMILDDVPSLTEDNSNREIKADEIAKAVADTVEKLSVPSVNVESSVNTLQEFDVEELDLFERLVECEARSEGYEGKLLVANVVLNRLATGIWGDSIESVINAPGQFQPVTSGAICGAEVSKETVDVCINALNGEDISKGALYFRKSKEKFWGDKQYLFRYGEHSFYK